MKRRKSPTQWEFPDTAKELDKRAISCAHGLGRRRMFGWHFMGQHFMGGTSWGLREQLLRSDFDHDRQGILGENGKVDLEVENNMDSFSTKVSEQIFATFPEWRSFAFEEESEDGASFLVIRVPPPIESKAEHPLHIDTSNREVTVGFDAYHSHYDAWASEDGKSFGADAAIDFVNKLLAEQIAVFSTWDGKGWRGSWQGQPTMDPSGDSLVQRGHIVKIRSWRGTYSRDVSIA